MQLNKFDDFDLYIPIAIKCPSMDKRKLGYHKRNHGMVLVLMKITPFPSEIT